MLNRLPLKNPAAGDYELAIGGVEIPFGPVKYYVLTEFIYDKIEVIYPIGGEGFVPKVRERLHWDAYGDQGVFDLEYSTDDGQSWNDIGTVPGDQRLADWVVPEVVTSKALVRITRGSVSDMSDVNFSIVAIPPNIRTEQACPTFLRIEWDTVPGATAYDVFRLGARYMDSVGTTTALTFDVPITNPLVENWYAVRAVGPDGLRGRRSNAEVYSDGLLNCTLDNDIWLSSIEKPLFDEIQDCGIYEDTVRITLFNNGMTDQTDIDVSYQVNSQPVVTETVPSIAAGDTITYSFNTLLLLDASDEYTLKTWVSATLDDFIANDSLTHDLRILLLSETVYQTEYMEDFQGVFPPPDWTIDNPEGVAQWGLASVIGKDGGSTRCAFMENRVADSGEEDGFFLPAIELIPGTSPPFLSFDLAYMDAADGNTSFSGELRIVVTDCDGRPEDEVYEKRNSGLATTPFSPGLFTPNSADDWRTELIDLSEYQDSTVYIRFTFTSGSGENIFIDNINVGSIAPPKAGINASGTVACRNGTLEFRDDSEGAGVEQTWSFGAGVIPPVAFGPGPHTPQFLVLGKRTIMLRAQNPAGADTAFMEIDVVLPPESDFDFIEDQGTVSFENKSSNADTYFWRFGDTNTSTQENPVHTYASTGNYNVRLTATNGCSSDVHTSIVQILMVSTEDNIYEEFVQILPNPSDGLFYLNIAGLETKELGMSVFDLTGKLIYDQQLTLQGGSLNQELDLKNISKGTYLLRLRSDLGTGTFKLIVQ